MPVSEPGKYYLHISDKAARQGILVKNVQSAASRISKGASIGATAGTIVPVIGNVIGAGIGAVLGGVLSLFSRDQKIWASKFFRRAMLGVLNELKPGSAMEVEHHLELSGDWDPRFIEKTAREVIGVLVNEMPAGSDDYNDLSLLAASIRVTQAAPAADRNTIIIFHGSPANEEASFAFGSQTQSKLASMNPIFAFGIAAAGIAIATQIPWK